MNTTHMRSAFSMITAIFVIVIMSSIGALIVNMGGKVVKITTDEYQHAQAELYAKSYTTYAIMAIEANNRSVDCLEDINANIGDNPNNGNGYRVRTRIAYITNASVDTSKCSSTRVLNSSVSEASTPLTVIIDVYVDYKDPDNPSGPWMTVHRRTIQKI